MVATSQLSGSRQWLSQPYDVDRLIQRVNELLAPEHVEAAGLLSQGRHVFRQQRDRGHARDEHQGEHDEHDSGCESTLPTLIRSSHATHRAPGAGCTLHFLSSAALRSARISARTVL